MFLAELMKKLCCRIGVTPFKEIDTEQQL